MKGSRRRAIAAALAGLVALAGAAPAWAIEPGALPEPVWWRPAPVLSLIEDPLGAIPRGARFEAEAEWAPLYADRDGGRFEQARRTLRLRVPAAGWRLAGELEARDNVARAGDGPWALGAEQPLGVRGALGVMRAGRRFAGAVAGGAREGRPGAAAGGRLLLLPGAEFGVGLSLWPERGQLEARWDDIAVRAFGHWTDRRAHWNLSLGRTQGLRVSLGQESLDRVADAPGEGDWIAPEAAWRASRFTLSGPGLHGRWEGSVEYGEGRQGLCVWRDGARYGRMTGPVTNGLVALGWSAARAPVALRAWAGRWRGEERGSLALWPFDDLGGLLGTRQVAHSNGSLDAVGLALDRSVGPGAGWDGGLALWSLSPRADYASWHSTVLGLGRTDESAGTVTLRSALLLGVRAAAGLRVAGTRIRLEGVQWLPLRVERAGTAAGGGSAGTPGVAVGGASSSGGTVLRISVIAAE
ncbi:MAG: hypothetical protein A2V63_04640 [Candidatus Eisenbacteria bacterium RBG_19FT_COMBO_70_11]|nr:MAG: hypothetical protein A2V63_04640 [Candidatus Eisenbacteria bacterium RBG_19FT_COMBO_70_11]